MSIRLAQARPQNLENSLRYATILQGDREQITAGQPIGARVTVDIAALGALKFEIEVRVAISGAREAARKALERLGAELATNFQYPGNLV